MLVAEKAVTREGIRRRQGHGESDRHVHADVDQAVDIAHVPRWVGQDQLVVVPGEVVRQQGETGKNLRVGLERHVDHPVDRQEREDDVRDHEDRALLELTLIHGHPPFPGCRHAASSYTK